MTASRWVESPNRPPRTEPDAEARGRRLASKAAGWIEASPGLFEEVTAIVAGQESPLRLRNAVEAECAARGVKLSTRRDKGEGSMFEHDLFAPLLRYMVLAHPELHGEPVEFGPSCVDHSGLPEVPAIGVVA